MAIWISAPKTYQYTNHWNNKKEQREILKAKNVCYNSGLDPNDCKKYIEDVYTVTVSFAKNLQNVIFSKKHFGARFYILKN